MKTILIDDEVYALRYLEQMCEKIKEIEVVASVRTVPNAMDYISNNHVDLVILDIEMPGITGIEAAETIHEKFCDTSIIFVTGYEEYALKAYQLEAVAYLLKPVQEEELLRAIHRAEKLSIHTSQKRMQIQTFGYFQVTIDGIPVRFPSAKSKELLALLVDRRGAVMSMEQVISVLWEDKPYDNLVKQAYRKAVMHLNHLCREYELAFFSSHRGSCFLDITGIECDYFRFLEGEVRSIESYRGEYLLDYGWAEYTIPKLNQTKGTL